MLGRLLIPFILLFGLYVQFHGEYGPGGGFQAGAIIASGIILLPQRDPIVLAKELAGIDVLSNGRLLFGLGVGYVPGEFEALGIPYEERGPRTSEHIEVLRTLWTQDGIE